MPPKQSRAVVQGQAYSDYEAIVRQCHQVDAKMTEYQRLVREVKARGNLQIPSGLTLQESEEELKDAETTQLYLAKEAERLSAKDKALDSLTNNLVTWLKTATDHPSYARTAAATNKVSLVFHTIAQFIKADRAKKHKSISDNDIRNLLEALEVIPEQAPPRMLELQRQVGEIDSALTVLGPPGEGLSAVQIIENLIPELLMVIRDMTAPGITTESLPPRLYQRLITRYRWVNDNRNLPQIGLGWGLTTSASTLSDSCDRIITHLRLLLFSEIPVPLQAVEALFSMSQQFTMQNLVRLVELLEVLWSNEPKLVDNIHAFITARMIEFIIRGLSRLDHGESQVLRLIQSWTRIYQDDEPLLIAYSRWFQNLQATPLTMPRVLELLRTSANVQAMQEFDTSRILYCNVLTGYHLLVQGDSLLLFDESSLELNAIDRLISFPDDQTPAFITNPQFEILNPMLRLHMRSLWLRGTT